jgi:uncharacterized membrane protein
MVQPSIRTVVIITSHCIPLECEVYYNTKMSVNTNKTLKVNIKYDLQALVFLVGLLTLIVFLFPSSVLRIVLGLPFVLFFPGYVLLAALYTKQGSISGVSVVALSFGLSLAVVPLIGLALNYMPWGITLQSILYSEAIYIVTMSGVAYFRRRHVSLEERFTICFTLDLSVIWGRGIISKSLSIVLIMAVLGVLITLGYVIAKPKVGEKFTEFYILGEAEKAQDYPRELIVDEQAKVIVGIVNHEYRSANYTVEVKIGDIMVSETGPVVLAHEEKWEGETIFSLQAIGRQKVEFFLYRDNAKEPYMEPLRLWIDVVGDEARGRDMNRPGEGVSIRGFLQQIDVLSYRDKVGIQDRAGTVDQRNSIIL